MANYDFTSSLAPLDFELLSKDLLEAELGILLENFRDGRDKGIDLRYAPQRGHGLIVQCKRYTAFASLKAELANKELAKIEEFKPARYLLTTSVALSPQQVDELKSLLSPFVLSTGDIFGRDRLNSILAKHQEIERRHFKLWVGSAAVLDSILNAGTHVVSREEVERTIAAAKVYVRNPSFDEALAILKKHHVCIISGIPGIGKTILARMLLLYFYERKFDVVKIESDISEAREVGYHKKPRFYYYDDFLGQTGQADKLNKNEDQKLLDFMRSVRDSKDSLLVLTTREYILNQARMHYEKLDREKFDHRTCVIDLSKYSRKIRAQILYNHLHFSDLPRQHVRSLVANRGYLQIVDHANYNPRLVEFLTSATWFANTPSNEYLSLFVANLDNPVKIWEHAFRNQLSPRARHLLFVLTTLPTEVILRDAETAFESFHHDQCGRFGIQHSSLDFRNALKELDGTFVASRKVEDEVLVRFQNPSIRDFMQKLLLGGEMLAEVIRSLTFFEQAQWLSETLGDPEPQIALIELSRHARSIADSLQRLSGAASCSFSVDGPEGWQRIRLKKANEASRLARIVSAVSSLREPKDDEFIANRVADLAARMETAAISAAYCLGGVEALKEGGYLLTEYGMRFLSALKSSAMNQREDLDDFQTLAEVVELLPKSFADSEVEEIRESYTDFATKYATSLAKGKFDIDDPEEIRGEAYRLENVGDLLGVDTDAEQKTIHDFADRKEMELEDRRDWDPDDESPRGRSLSENCPDSELDSMFGTLKE
jgi:hypothetical protein